MHRPSITEEKISFRQLIVYGTGGIILLPNPSTLPI